MTRIGRPVYPDELMHHQVKGGKWGVRRWQYPDDASDALAQYFEEKARYLAKQERGDSDDEFYWYFDPEEEKRHKKS